jgi:LacI family transcriptional regulator
LRPPSATLAARKNAPERVTLTQVALAAGVSIGTASQILNARANAYVSERTRVKVHATARRLGYIPNTLARSLRMQKSHTIGAVMATPTTSAAFAENLTNLQHAAEQRGYRVHVAYHFGDPKRQAAMIREMIGLCVDGLVLQPVASSSDVEPLIVDLLAQRFPLVTIDGPDHWPTCDASVDRELGGYLQVKHLLALGRRKIVFIVPDGRVGQGRFAGHRRALEEAAMKLDPAMLITRRSSEDLRVEGLEATRELLASGFRGDAIVTHDDHLSLGVIEALLDAGVKVPEDVALVSYDDDYYAAHLAVSLTSVHHPRDVGPTALELVLEQMNGAAETKRVKLAPRLVVRESTVKGAGRGAGSPDGSAMAQASTATLAPWRSRPESVHPTNPNPIQIRSNR